MIHQRLTFRLLSKVTFTSVKENNQSRIVNIGASTKKNPKVLIDQVFKRCIQGSAGEKISSSLTLCVLQNFRINGPLYDAVSIAEDDQWRRIRSVLTPSFTTGRQKEVSASPGQTGLSAEA